MTLVLFGRNIVQTNVDNAPEGPSVGDEVVITAALFTKATGGESVGRLDVHRVTTSTDGGQTRVVDQISETLSRGQIVAAGSGTFRGTPGELEGDKARRSIVGGTGAYRLVQGVLQTEFIGESNVTKLTHKFYPQRCASTRRGDGLYVHRSADDTRPRWASLHQCANLGERRVRLITAYPRERG